MKTLAVSAAVFCVLIRGVIGGVLPVLGFIELREDVTVLAVILTVLVYTPIVGVVYYVRTLLQCNCNCTRCTDHCESCT